VYSVSVSTVLYDQARWCEDQSTQSKNEDVERRINTKAPAAVILSIQAISNVVCLSRVVDGVLAIVLR
jgi:hypothetical protein